MTLINLLGAIGNTLLGWAALLSLVSGRHRPRLAAYDLVSIYSALAGVVLMIIDCFLQSNWGFFSFYVVGFIVLVVIFIKRRKQRRVAMKLIGDKTKQILAKMVKKIPRTAGRLQPA